MIWFISLYREILTEVKNDDDKIFSHNAQFWVQVTEAAV